MSDGLWIADHALERTGLSLWVGPWDYWLAQVSPPVAQLGRCAEMVGRRGQVCATREAQARRGSGCGSLIGADRRSLRRREGTYHNGVVMCLPHNETCTQPLAVGWSVVWPGTSRAISPIPREWKPTAIIAQSLRDC